MKRFCAFFSLIVVLIDPIFACQGCVDLDEVTFDKIVKKFDYSVIKFDIAFPYGEKHDNYAKFAKEMNAQIGSLLVGIVGIKDYGEKDNEIFLKRFNIPEKSFPAIILLKKDDLKTWVQFPSDQDVTVDNLKNFVRQNTDLYVGLNGCIKQFDELASIFMANFNRNEFAEIEKAMKTGNRLLDELSEEHAKSGNIYLQVMKRISEKGIKFIKEEQDRVKKLLGTKITEAKKKELNQRLNIMLSFRDPSQKMDSKSEL